MNRTESKINKYLSQSQSTYRKSRSTTDVVWVHRWMAAKVQDILVIAIFITPESTCPARLTQSYRDELFNTNIEEFLNEDGLQILITLLAETTFEVKVENAQATRYIGSPLKESGDRSLHIGPHLISSPHCTSTEPSN